MKPSDDSLIKARKAINDCFGTASGELQELRVIPKIAILIEALEYYDSREIYQVLYDHSTLRTDTAYNALKALNEKI